MLSPSAAFEQAVYRSGYDICRLVTIDNNTTTWKFTDKPCLSGSDLFGLTPAIYRVDAFESEVNPLTHDTNIGRMSVTIQDAAIRSVINDNRLRGMKMSVALGATSLSEADFETFFTGFIVDHPAQPGGNVVLIDALSTWSIVGDMEIVGAFANSHPLNNIEKIFFTKLGLDGTLYDAASLQPSAAANAAHSHLQATRFKPSSIQGTSWATNQDTTVVKPVSAKKLISENLQIVDGYIVPGADGKLAFKNFDPSAAAVAHWDADVIDELEQLEDWGTIINHAIVRSMGEYFYEQNDDTSQSNHGYSFITDKKESLDIDNLWLRGGIGVTAAEKPASTHVPIGATEMWLWPGTNFAGYRASFPLATQPTDARPLSTPILNQTQVQYGNSPTTEGTFTAGSGYAALDQITLSDGTVVRVSSTGGGGSILSFVVLSISGSDGSAFRNEALTQSSTTGGGTGFTLTPDTDNLTITRPLYWMLISVRDGGSEIVKVTTQHTVPTYGPSNKPVYGIVTYEDPDPSVSGASYGFATLAIAKIERAQLGTSAREFKAAYVVDITPQVYMCEKVIDRFSESAPMIQVTTNLSQFAVEQTDLVTIDWPQFLAYNADGIDNTTKWQVLSKEIDSDADSPQIRWSLMRATVGTPTRSHRVWSNDLSSPRAVALRNAVDNRHGAPRIGSLEDDFNVTDGGGLTVDISSGIIVNQSEEFRFIAFEGLTLTASSDNYIFANVLTGSIVVIETDVGADRPTAPVGFVPIAKVETDATSIVDIVNLRPESQVTVLPDAIGAGIMRLTSGIVPNGDFSDWGL